MSLTISDLVFDEGGLIDLDNDADNNVASLSFLTAGQSAVIAALPKASFPAFAWRRRLSGDTTTRTYLRS